MSPGSRAIWLAAAVAALVAFVPAPAAFAKRHSIAASARHHNFLVFKLEDIAPPSVRSARLRMGGHARRMPVRAVRAAARRGTLRARVPKRWRRSSRSSHSTRTQGRSARAQQRPPKLVLMISSSVPSEPTTVTPSPPPSPPAPLPPDAKFVSASGSDSDPGTESAPWRTIAKAISAAQPGDTIVLAAGTYGARGTTTNADTSGTATAPITFMGHPGQPKPMILGHFKIDGDYLRFSRLFFNGPTGRVKDISSENPKGEQVQVTINGDHDTISNSEIANSDWHAGIYLSGAEDARIVGNYIHDNGDDGSCCHQYQWNASHGIYFSSGSGLIANNVIEHNLARGVQLYKHPHDVLVTENTIVRNGRAGVQVAKETANSTVANNIVAYNGDTGIRSDSLSGTGNLVIDNLLWENAYPGRNLDGLTLRDNVSAAPRFVNSTDYHVQRGSPAIDQANASYAVTDDHDGVRRPQGGAPDIGAFEAH
ncbi:MAG TPA: right-handed parallel beta-helix repeat-containing protein [Solirubrobacterales bacterium]|nr:right-handed parallel beta-helix repeat-containing protein [Solirubrobacterales bacterium]